MTTSTLESLWLRRFHDGAEGRPVLVCFPHAGGAAGFYFPVSRDLVDDVDVLAVQHPGRQDRRTERSATSIAELADRVSEVLRPHGPVALFGHSMGALVAFEVARRLEAAGVEPLRLLVSGRAAPSCAVGGGVHTRDDDGIIAELAELSGTDHRVLGDDEIMRHALPALRADYTAVETYHCPRDVVVSCPISLLVGDSDRRVPVDDALAWRGHTTGAFDSEVFPGGHFYLTDQRAGVLRRVRRLLLAGP
ncbi:thioesterase II family protein [Actinosynnema sp. CA-248983]